MSRRFQHDSVMQTRHLFWPPTVTPLTAWAEMRLLRLIQWSRAQRTLRSEKTTNHVRQNGKPRRFPRLAWFTFALVLLAFWCFQVKKPRNHVRKHNFLSVLFYDKGRSLVVVSLNVFHRQIACDWRICSVFTALTGNDVKEQRQNHCVCFVNEQKM